MYGILNFVIYFGCFVFVETMIGCVLNAPVQELDGFLIKLSFARLQIQKMNSSLSVTGIDLWHITLN